jgi:DNA-binding protein H-NS
MFVVIFRWKSKIDMYQLNEMSLDELWRLHEAIVAELSRKMTAEKVKLEERLRKIDPDALSRSAHRKRPSKSK